MKIIGIDPGLSKIGLTVLSFKEKKILDLNIHFLSTQAHTPHAQRLTQIFFLLNTIFSNNKISVTSVFVEKVFFNRNITSSHKVSQVIGLIYLLCNLYNFQIFELTPTIIKKYVTGQGRATKIEVKQKIIEILNNLDLKKNLNKCKKDEIDSISCALTG